MAPTISFDTFHNIINNQLKGADKQYHGINPFTEEKLWPTPVATENDVEEAVIAANAAFKKWSKTPVEERKKAVRALADGLMEHKAEFEHLVEVETGKAQPLAAGEIQATYSFSSAQTNFDVPEHTTHEDDDVKVVTRYVPLGVVAGICPWNFPLMLGAAKIAAAVLTGNTIIIKPSPYTPYSNLKFVELASHYFPPGVIQALGGDDNLGPLLVKHPDIAKISFTGSSATGKKIMANAAPTLKRVTLELGGNDAAIVCADVDVDHVAQVVSQSVFSHAGQICVASKRIYVHASIYEAFMQKFTEASKQLVPGTGILSPIQNSMQYDKVKSIYDDCKAQKYTFSLGDGTIPKDKSGYFVPPTIVAKPPEKSRVVVEEPFGPIVPVLTWEEESDVLERANDTTQGLGATVFCRDPTQAQRIADGLEAGSIWINRGVLPLPTALFGGHKQSGVGGEWGPLGMLSYCNAKTYHYSKKV